ncbi:hypothetical protein [Streptomyces sp. NPDC001828]|uniref:hypothetical protein n=1 Tax=Streptomyces sp. NPDC001828 TaxID=3364615 RepID=UPI00367B36DF
MPENAPNSKGPAPAQYQPAATQADPVRVPLSDVKAEDITPLAIEYRDGKPVIVVTNGTVLPAGLAAVGQDGKTLAVYTAGQATSKAREELNFGWQVNVWGVGDNSWTYDPMRPPRDR